MLRRGLDYLFVPFDHERLAHQLELAHLAAHTGAPVAQPVPLGVDRLGGILAAEFH